MMTITGDTWGTVYLLHFSAPLGNPANRRAQALHYLGWALDLEQRLAEHRAGAGAAITRAAIERGLTFTVVAAWPGTPAFERRLKRRKEAPKLCAICCAAHGRAPCRPALAGQQLALPLDTMPDGWDFDQVPPPAQAPRADWYEISWWRRWRAGRAAAAALATSVDAADGDLPF